MVRSLLLLSAVAVMVFSGVVHGLWTDRWADKQDLGEAGERVEAIPEAIGAWKGETLEFKCDPRAGVAAALSRRYVHQVTGKAVTVYVGCGRPGPVSVHTPEVCYAGAGYDIERARPIQLSDIPGQAGAEFFTARVTKTKSDRRFQQRIFWSWHADGNWRVSDNPRLAFAGESILHKLYVLRDQTGPEMPLEEDLCVEFMREFLPALKTTLKL